MEIDLKQFSEMVNTSSQHVKRELESIDTKLALGSIISFFLAIGLSAIFELLQYWAASSFLIMYIWSIRSIVKTKKPNIRDMESTQQKLKDLGTAKARLGFEWLFFNLSSVIKSVSSIYVVTFLFYILVITGVLTFQRPVPIIIPLITTIVYGLSPFFLDRSIPFFTEGHYMKSMEKSLSLKKPKLIIAGMILGVSLLLLLMLFLPIWAFIDAISFIFPLTLKSILFVVVLIIQLFLIAVLSSYFSSILAKKELTNTLTNYANINDRINALIIKGNIDENIVSELQNSYLTAKKYDVFIDDYFKFVNFYFLRMNRTYLENI